ncbi:MAG TPA: energy-coupling factor transporter transmembrane protein EcfT [Actinopolymorphaceae bacterium]|jgi:biotin transport system permease protein
MSTNDASGSLGLYRPGDSSLHRLPAVVKLTGLAVAGVVVLTLASPLAVAGAAVSTVVLTILARIPWRVALTQIRPVLWFALPLLAFQWFTAGWVRATVVVGQLLVVVALAALVTLTTRVSDMLEVFERGLRPLARLGVNPTRVGLVLALTVRCIPLVAQTYAEVREARRARGLEHSVTALVVPVVIRLLKKADALGEGLAARGLDD